MSSDILCFICNQRLQLIETIINKCKCKNYYCFEHKIPEKHECTFNYKLQFQTQLTSNMPLVKKNQLDKTI